MTLNLREDEKQLAPAVETPAAPIAATAVTPPPLAYLRKTCEESLQRLGIDCLDILCMSRVDPSVPVEESVGTLAQMVKEGKTRYIALSEASPESIRRAWTCAAGSSTAATCSSTPT